MEQNNGDLLVQQEKETIRRWVFFNKLEIKMVEKQQDNNSQ